MITITENDLKELQKDIEKIIKYSQDYPFDINCEEIIKKWYESKKYFLDLFDGATHVMTEEDREFFLDETGKRNYFIEFVRKITDLGFDKNIYEGCSFYNFLSENESTFFMNKVSSLPNSLANQSKIRRGDKLIKSFKFFFRNARELDFVQNLASQYTQKNKVKGKLVISVDPIDYLLASENNENWRSCHALDGEFRSGNLSYMLDDSTVIAYVTNGERQTMQMLPPDMDDYSKKLRIFIHWNKKNDVLYFSKTYPFDAPSLRIEIKDIINNLYEEKRLNGKIRLNETKKFSMPILVGFNQINLIGSTDSREHYLNSNWLYYKGEIFNTKKVISHSPFALNYNDIITSSSYAAYVCFNTNCDIQYNRNDVDFEKILENKFKIKIGETAPCVRGCGNHIEHSDSFLCNNCIKELDITEDYFTHCYECGRRLWPEEDDIYYEEDYGEKITLCKRCHGYY